MNLLSAYGIGSFTMDRLASRLHTSKRTLYMHFQSKDQLLEECLNEWLRRKRIFACKGDNLIDSLCTLYAGIRAIDLQRAVCYCRELRQCSPSAYRFLLEQFFSYADKCSAMAERSADAGYLCRTVSPHTVAAVVSDMLVRIFDNEQASILHRSRLMSPEIIIVFTRGMCTIKGRAHLDRKLKTLA